MTATAESQGGQRLSEMVGWLPVLWPVSLKKEKKVISNCITAPRPSLPPSLPCSIVHLSPPQAAAFSTSVLSYFKHVPVLSVAWSSFPRPFFFTLPSCFANNSSVCFINMLFLFVFRVFFPVPNITAANFLSVYFLREFTLGVCGSLELIAYQHTFLIRTHTLWLCRESSSDETITRSEVTGQRLELLSGLQQNTRLLTHNAFHRVSGVVAGLKWSINTYLKFSF